MQVDPATSQHHARHDGDDYYFCSARCLERFLASPDKYLSPSDSEPDPALAGATYTCPMHPEVRQIGPGTCPICGMALEPEMPSLADEERSEGRRVGKGCVVSCRFRVWRDH